jgi:hypothetical protein
MSRDDAALIDIAHAARLVLEFKGTLDKQAFLKDLLMVLVPREPLVGTDSRGGAAC